VGLLTDEQLAGFADAGSLVVPAVVRDDAVDGLNAEVDRLVAASPPPAGHVGQHFYWLRPPDAPALFSVFHETPIASLARALVEPGELEIAFDQAQVALNIPPFSHRPGRPHLDGYVEGQREPGTFTMLVAVLLTDQDVENAGNLWVWPGTHRTHAAFFREHGPGALVDTKGHPDIALPEPVQIVGRRGDVLFAHSLLGHNIGGNYEGDGEVRRALYWRVRRLGHEARWRECLQDELLEYDAVRAAKPL
jgi:phytanoyl-CoA dioxygenase PhyH